MIAGCLATNQQLICRDYSGREQAQQYMYIIRKGGRNGTTGKLPLEKNGELSIHEYIYKTSSTMGHGEAFRFEIYKPPTQRHSFFTW